MKWHILYLIVVLLSLSSIVSPNLETTATQRSSDGQLIGLALSSDRGIYPNVWQANWSDVMWAYGALPERVTSWRRTRRAKRPKKKRPDRKANPSTAKPPPEQADLKSEDEHEPPPADQDACIPLRLVLRPGVILMGTKGP